MSSKYDKNITLLLISRKWSWFISWREVLLKRVVSDCRREFALVQRAITTQKYFELLLDETSKRGQNVISICMESLPLRALQLDARFKEDKGRC